MTAADKRRPKDEDSAASSERCLGSINVSGRREENIPPLSPPPVGRSRLDPRCIGGRQPPSRPLAVVTPEKMLAAGFEVGVAASERALEKKEEKVAVPGCGGSCFGGLEDLNVSCSMRRSTGSLSPAFCIQDPDLMSSSCFLRQRMHTQII